MLTGGLDHLPPGISVVNLTQIQGHAVPNQQGFQQAHIANGGYSDFPQHQLNVRMLQQQNHPEAGRAADPTARRAGDCFHSVGLRPQAPAFMMPTSSTPSAFSVNYSEVRNLNSDIRHNM